MLLPFIRKTNCFCLKIVFQWRPYVLQQSQGPKYIAKPQQKKTEKCYTKRRKPVSENSLGTSTGDLTN